MTRSRSHAEMCCRRPPYSFFGGGQVSSACSEKLGAPLLAFGKAPGMGSRWQHSICFAERKMADQA